jgi:hypothetical protein
MFCQIALGKLFAFSELESEGVGFEPTVPLQARLISSQVHSTTLPPFHLIESGKIMSGESIANSK